ncbi:protein INVOLVED IN DE NOVO 2-like [Sesamum indicum]|uniref:Protein INVOLVED IN DE NOVO 2-like n=1 Tax=Sesamum indicum TaxID=4182 RepID=A0A6I9TZI6_SESIN|nr:protein INVOLVED IN DE NOVO 2-like [Sesamum indicum]XP_011089484.1 protein INVOLVED IN DE NOVO 2-like [Sesamum indicum]
MSYSSEEETDISDSELDEYVDRCYEQLKDGSRKVKFSDEVYRCPYCPGKKKLVYALKDLLQHASDVGKGSQNRDIKHKGKHLGLVRYIKDDLAQEDLSSELAGLALEVPTGNGVSELFVWPWMGILANVDAEKSSRLKNDLAERGFDPVRVRLLSTGGYAVVEFKRDWSGFYRAIMFEKEFEVDRRGKKDYCASPHLADELYGWVARDDDYNLKGSLGEYLQKNGDLKTISDLVVDEKRKTGLLIANLSNTIQELRTRVDELESNYCKPPAADIHVASQKDEIQ